MICDILIIGGDGDLALRKLYPALYHLDQDQALSPCFRIVAVARRELGTEGFRELVQQRLVAHGIMAPEQGSWKRFAERLHYKAADATSERGLLEIRNAHFPEPQRQLIIYLATPPAIFAPVCQSLWAVGLVRPATRLVVEKPLGSDLQTFRDINASLTAIFDESQVYRIDHYLGKETVQNLLALRFANSLFEPLWNNRFIDHVQITVAETVGIEGRWQFYDDAGALRDMVQNHLLQLLCLVAMEPPTALDAASVHDEKLKVLRALKPFDRQQCRENTVRGQYQNGAIDGQPVPAYIQEQGARAGSATETFVALKAQISNWRWTGVPFYIRTGKRLQRRYSEIVIQFKEVPHIIFGEQFSGGNANRLIIRLQPDEGIRLQLRNKTPGLDDPMALEAVSLDLSLSKTFTSRRVPDAYERLLFDVMRGNSALFMRADQVEAAWCWIDGIIDGWRSGGKKASAYTAGSWGPTDSVALIARDGRNWDEG